MSTDGERQQTPQQAAAAPSSSVSRREAIQLSAAAGAAAAIITSRKSLAEEDTYPPPGTEVPPAPDVCPTRPTNSPPTRPFLQEMPIPVAKAPRRLSPEPTLNANTRAGEAARPAHQRWNEFLPQVTYEMSARPAMHRFHPDLPPSYVWGFDGRVPGPTFINHYGRPTLVRIHNDLPPNHTGFGINEITVHLHNGHTPYESDGFAADYYGPGFWKDMHYPNVLAGYDAFPPKGDVREAMHTLWYHDHRHTFTSPNTYRGLAAMYFLYDDIDSGNENDQRRTALRLPAPYGVYDIPLIMSDKLFCADGTLFAGNNPGGVPAGDKFCVNGVIQPYFRVQRRKYRFRVLATGPTRSWNFTLSNGWPFTVIATDGNLLQNPVSVANLPVSVAERFDFVLDFSKAQAGEKIYLVNAAAQFVGNAPEPEPVPGLPIGNVVMRFDVVGGTVQDNSRVPATLTTYPPVTLSEVVATRTLDFDLVNGQFLINGLVFDENTPLFSVKKGTAERWRLRNILPAAGWTHPIHIHFEEFRVLSRNGAAPSALESGRKDVITLPGGHEIELFMRFRDFKGKYMLHCHNMNHEDNFMLARFDIVD